MIGKKGLSPLIATVILIAFAVSLGAVVMTAGKNFVGSTVRAVPIAGCEGVSLQLIDGVSTTQLTLEFMLKPKAPADKKIAGIKVWVQGGQNTLKQEIAEEIEVGYPYTKKIDYDIKTYGSVKQARFTPIVNVNGIKQACPDGEAVYNG